jgi:phosphoribosylformylglycinamidine synthase
VSFYNQHPGGAVYPTPTIGMVGLLEDIDTKMTLDFKQAGDAVYLLGEVNDDINSSEYIHKLHGVEYSPVPHFDLEEEYRLQKTVSKLISSKAIASAHDLSEGGLFVTLCESGFNNDLGFNATTSDKVRPDAFWFGESQSRVAVSVGADQIAAFEKIVKESGVPFAKVAEITDGEVIVDGTSWGDIAYWKEKYDTAIEKYMQREEQYV